MEPDHAWCTGTTHVPMRRCFLYLAAIMDWAGRKVLGWCFSNPLDADFYVAALREAPQRLPRPRILNQMCLSACL